MKTKLLEVRDRGTFIPVLAVQVSGEDGYLARRAGFELPQVYVVKLTDDDCALYPHDWPERAGGTRTMMVAHEHIAQHFEELEDESVVDVEFILGEAATKKKSERFE